MSENKKYKSIIMEIEKIKKYLGNIGLLPLNENKIPACGPYASPISLTHKVDEFTKIYGIRLNNLVLVDIDTDKKGVDIPDDWKNNTYTQRTGGGGLHYVFRKDIRFENWKQSRNGITDKLLDIKTGNNQFFVGAGSKSKKGVYTIINEQKPTRMPDELFDYLNPHMDKRNNNDKQSEPMVSNNNSVVLLPSQSVNEENPNPMKIEKLTKIIDMCPTNYFDNYDDWQKNGWAIHYATNGSLEGLELFKKKSKSVSGYESKPDNEFVEFWNNSNSFAGKKYTIGSIIYKLKKDNIWTPINDKIFRSQDSDIALRANDLFGEEFFYNISDSIVYQWNNTYWKAMKNPKMLSTKLIKRLKKYYFKQLNIYLKLDNEHPDEYNSYTIIAETLKNIYTNVRKRNFVDKIKDTFITLIRQVEVIDLNKNYDEFVFNNCCINLSTGLKSEPQKQNLATLCAGYDYKASTEKDRDELQKVLNTIFDNNEVLKNYTLLLLGTALCGIPIPKFVAFKGHGRNGKGTINEIMKPMLGDYYYKLNHKTLVKGKGQDRQDINNIKFKRMLLTTEPDANGELDTNLMKDICSNDTTVNARALFKTDSRVPKFCSAFMECQDLPRLDQSGEDDALRERLVIIEFLAGFISENDKRLNMNGGRIGKRHYHKKNPIYVSNAWREKMKFALFDILIKKCGEFLKDQNVIDNAPESITASCSNYFLSNNDILAYFNENYFMDKDKHTFMKIKNVRQKFILSEIYLTSSKKEQQKFLPNKFQKLMADQFPENYHKRKWINGKDYSNILLNWAPIPIPKEDNDDDGEDEGDFIDDLE